MYPCGGGCGHRKVGCAGLDDPEKACDKDHNHLPNFLSEDSDNECGEQFSLEEAFFYEVDLDIQGKQSCQSRRLGKCPYCQNNSFSNDVNTSAHPQDMDYAYRGKDLKDLNSGGICMRL